MPSANNLLAVTAILALTTLPSGVIAKKNLRKTQRRNLRRDQIQHIDEAHKEDAGLEEDVAFWTNMARRTQDMSAPVLPPSTNLPEITPPPVPMTNLPETDPPVVVDPTDPPAGGNVPTPTITLPPQPVAAIICAQGETCVEVDSRCSDGTTEECCDQTFDSFVCDCKDMNGELKYECFFTDACLAPVCETDPPVPGTPPESPAPTPPPAQGFICPDPSFVGCTAVDPQNPEDECPTVGEPCADGTQGTFCCPDACPRNYCTAKQAPMSLTKSLTKTESTVWFVPIPDQNEWAGALDNP